MAADDDGIAGMVLGRRLVGSPFREPLVLVRDPSGRVADATTGDVLFVRQALQPAHAARDPMTPEQATVAVAGVRAAPA